MWYKSLKLKESLSCLPRRWGVSASSSVRTVLPPMIKCDKEHTKSLRLKEASLSAKVTDPIAENLRVVHLSGQRCVYDSTGYLYFWLQHGAFYSAGKIYGWPGSSACLGANREILQYAIEHNARIRVFLKDQFDRCYEADPKAWRYFARKYNAVDVRKGVLIFLYQWKEGHFRTIRDDPVLAVVAALLQGGT